MKILFSIVYIIRLIEFLVSDLKKYVIFYIVCEPGMFQFQESKIRIDDFKYTFDSNYTNVSISLKEFRDGVIFNSRFEYLVEVPMLLV
jgi:hypothetical protein